VLDYSLLFMFFSFVEWSSVYPWAALDYIPGGWLGELHVMGVAHLFVLQIQASSFGASW
jgi:hypothetical protein